MSEIRTPEPTVDEALDIQHDPFPAEDHGAAKRTPHLGHVALLCSLLALAALVVTVGLALASHNHAGIRENAVVQIGWEASVYLLTIAASFWVFPLFWKRSFLSGIEWNALAARRRWPLLLATGVALSLLSALSEHLVTLPKHTVLDDMLSTAAGAWSTALLGTLLAPAFEEMVFRGFLLPAFATAYDWLSLERTPAGLERWRTSTAHTVPAKVFGSLLSSFLFGLLHAPQLHFAWGAVAIITCVGLVLAFVRLRTHSLACSTIVHMAYNGTLFVGMLIVSHGFRHLDRLQS